MNMLPLPTITLELDAEEQDLLLQAIQSVIDLGDLDPAHVEQYQMLHNLIVQRRVEAYLGHNWDPA